MIIKVVYHSQTGNTRKVAEAIAKAVNVSAEDIASCNELAEPIDLLFLGDGLYAGNVSKAMRKFIDALNSASVKNVALFSTFGGKETATGRMRERLAKKGIEAASEVFGCKGKAWFILNRKRPNDDDLRNAAAFAQRIVQAFSGA